ncbi:MAG: TerB family tellurite resistance protein [Flavobacteriaceae bacterium]|nr:TerB family tellurite resistance protein [Flavobacteriaceae bacterium]
MQNERKRALISDLILLAKADEKLTGSELDFIYRLANRMQVTPEEVDQLMGDPLPSKPIFSELERITHFHKLVLLMNVDRETHPKEVSMIRNFGLKMGIRPGAIDQILQTMENYEDKVIPAQKLIEIFQTYYN